MKKILAFILCAAMALSMVACGSNDENVNDGGADNTVTDAPEITVGANGDETADEEPVGDETVDEEPVDEPAGITDSKEILTTVWATYAEEDKFAIMGGTSTMNEPDSIEIAGNESVLDNTVALPSDCVELIDDAATMIHMLNANTFSCGVFRVTDSQNVATVTEKIRDNVLNRQWICGFPDKLVITTIGNYVVSAFGNEEIIDTFQAALESCYEDAELVYEESLL